VMPAVSTSCSPRANRMTASIFNWSYVGSLAFASRSSAANALISRTFPYLIAFHRQGPRHEN